MKRNQNKIECELNNAHAFESEILGILTHQSITLSFLFKVSVFVVSIEVFVNESLVLFDINDSDSTYCFVCFLLVSFKWFIY